MSKEDQKIMAIEREILCSNKYFQGFLGHKEHDYESLVLNQHKIGRRGDLENDPSHKQPIGYMMVVNSETKKVYAYQRSVKDKEYGEKRLQGKWSWGVGGHIEPHDIGNGNSIRESMLRELNEEIKIIGKIKNINVLGYINDDLDSVGKVHFGILYLVEVDGSASPKDKEMAQGKMFSINELEKICSSENFDVENWSKIALEPLKKYFDSI